MKGNSKLRHLYSFSYGVRWWEIAQEKFVRDADVNNLGNFRGKAFFWIEKLTEVTEILEF